MKTLIRRTIAAIAAIICLAALTGCSCSTETESEDFPVIEYTGVIDMESAGASFDTIVCRYVFIPLYSPDPSKTYTIYADNTVEVEREIKNDTDEEYVVQYEFVRKFRITNKERKAIENAISKSWLWELRDCPDCSVTDGSSEYIVLFDADSNFVRTIGGYNPTEPRFRAVADLISRIIEDHS